MSILDYAVTLKENRIAFMPTRELYEPILDSLEQRGAILCQKSYEYDTKGRLHVHCYFQARKGFFWAQSIPNGMHKDIRILKASHDKRAWAHYLMKPDLAQYAFLDGPV